MKQIYRVGPLIITDESLHVGERLWPVHDIETTFIRKQTGIIYRLGIVFWGFFLLLGYFTFINPVYDTSFLNIVLPMDGQELAFGICVCCGFSLCVLNLAFPRKFLIILTSTGEWPVLFSRRCVKLLGAWHAVHRAIEQIHLEDKQQDRTLFETVDFKQPTGRFIKPARKMQAPNRTQRRNATSSSSAAEQQMSFAHRHVNHRY